MTIRFLRPENSTPRAFNRALLGVALALVAAGFTAAASSSEQQELTTYSAQYQGSTWRMKVKTNRQLKRSADGTFTLTEGGKNLVAGINQVSVFAVEGTRVIPRSFVYQLSGLASRRREVHFEHDKQKIRSLYKDQWYELPYTAGTLDRFSRNSERRRDSAYSAWQGLICISNGSAMDLSTASS